MARDASLFAKRKRSNAIGLTFSILLELIGSLLWYEAMRRETTVITPLNNCVTLGSNNGNAAVTHIVTTLQEAVMSGECQKTVRGIRAFLGCSQSQAIELRRQLQ